MVRLTKPGRRGQPSCSTDGVSQFREEIRERILAQLLVDTSCFVFVRRRPRGMKKSNVTLSFFTVRLGRSAHDDDLSIIDLLQAHDDLS